MDISCILFDEQQHIQLIQGGWLPEYIVPVMDRCVIFGGITEDGQLISIAVYLFDAHAKDTVRLEYIYVIEQYRGKKAAMGLTKQCEDILSQQGYLPCADPIYMRSYTHSRFDGRSFLALTKKREHACSSVIRIDDYHDRRLTRFIGQYRDAGFYISEREYDPDLCRFYVEEGSIKAALCLYVIGDAAITNLRPFIAPNIKTLHAMTYMSAVLYRDICDILDPDAQIRLYFDNKNVFDTYKKYIRGEQTEAVLPVYSRKTKET